MTKETQTLSSIYTQLDLCWHLRCEADIKRRISGPSTDHQIVRRYLSKSRVYCLLIINTELQQGLRCKKMLCNQWMTLLDRIAVVVTAPSQGWNRTRALGHVFEIHKWSIQSKILARTCISYPCLHCCNNQPHLWYKTTSSPISITCKSQNLIESKPQNLEEENK